MVVLASGFSKQMIESFAKETFFISAVGTKNLTLANFPHESEKQKYRPARGSVFYFSASILCG